MNCQQCQSENSFDAIFCDQCGARLETACPKCGEPNRQGARFCRNCGQLINHTAAEAPVTVPGVPSPETYVPRHLAEKILASRQSLEGERKQVTVLFADIRDSTKLVEGLDPEEAQKVIDPVLRVMMDAVHRYEGTVNQVLGDGIMALFGAPLAHEDHGVRACYAALAMQEEMRRFREDLGQSEELGLQIGIGLNSGEVVVRTISNDLNVDYSALGHTTHLAARMQELAGPGVILITAATLREVEGFVEVKSLGAVRAKGVSRPVDAYALVGATAARTRLHAAVVRGLTPFVGRKTEIETFKKVIEKSASGRGQIFAMVGEPGMGKSRLIHEFIQSHVPRDWLVLEAPSVSYGKATPYAPVVELLHRYFEISESTGTESVPEMIVDHVLRLDEMLKDAIPPILALLGALPDYEELALADQGLNGRRQNVGAAIKKFNDMEPQQRRRHTFESLKRLMIRESQQQPVLVVFEDLHWIDNETQAFLDSLVESLPMVRMLLLVNYRPGYNHNWADKTYYTHLRVDPLQSASAEELLQHLLGNNKELAPLKESLTQRTEGNPFFAEESVRSLVETGILVGEKGDYKPGLALDSIRIPRSVQTVLADRIDRLPIDEKSVLQMAAVIGVNVPFSLLRAVSGMQEGELYQYLSKLQAAEFLYESNLFPALEYSFKHALTAEVAYGALLHERRTSLHAHIAKALEEMTENTPHDHLEKLAHHAFQGELWDKAVNYLKETGAKAVSLSSFRNAVLCLERALEALRRLPKSPANVRRGIDLRIDIRSALFVFQDFKRGFEYLGEAQEAAKALNDQDRLGEVLTWMTAHWNLEGNSEQAVITGKQALKYTVGQKNFKANVVAHNWLGVAYHNLGQFEPSINELEAALSLIPEDQKYSFFGTNGIVSVNCKGWLIRSLAQIGNFSETRQYGDEAVQTATERDYPLSIVFAYYAIGVVALIKGEFDQAITALERSLSVCEAVEIPVQRPLVVSCLAAAYAFVGRFDEALGLLQRTTDRNAWLTGAGSRQLPFGKAMRMVWEVEAFMLTDQRCEAEALARTVLGVSRESKDRGSEAWLRCLLGDLLARASSMQAEDSYREALALAQDLGMRPLQAHCYFGLGQVHAQCGKAPLAQSELHAATELYRTMSMSFWVAKAEIALAAVC